MKKNRMHRSRIASFIGLVTVGGMLLAGCSSTSEQPAPEEPSTTEEAGDQGIGTPEIEPLAVAAWRANSHVTPIVAEDEGIAAGYGLSIEFVAQESAPAGAALLQSGDVQIYSGSYPGVIDAIRSGLPFRILAEQTSTGVDINTLEVLPDSDIEDVLDLQGKTIAVNGLNTATDLRIKYAVLDAGGDPATINFVALPYGEMASALELGSVDGAQMYGPGLLQAREVLNTRTILDIGKGVFEDFAETGWVTTADNLEKYPNAIAAFQCAMRDATQLIISDNELYLNTTAEFTGITAEQVAAQGEVNWSTETRPERIAEVGEMMQGVGLIPADEQLDIAAAVVPFPTNCNS